MEEKLSKVKSCLEAHPEIRGLKQEAQEVSDEWARSRLKFLQTRALFHALKQTQFDHPTSQTAASAALRQNLFRPDDPADLIELASIRCPKIDKADPKIIGCLTSNLDSATGSLMGFYPELASSSASSAKLPEAVARDMKDYDEVSSLDGGAPPDMEAAVARRQTDQTQLNLLTDMVENNYLKKTPDQVKANVDHLEAKQSALEKKLAWTQAEVKSAIYNAVACKKLEQLRYKLLEQTKEAKQEVSVLRKKLSEYQAVAAGADYQAVVDAYATVTADIEGKEWALARFEEENANEDEK